jgi:outer membrane protein OmpA-like peptidoglycan-associated protein
MKYGILSLLWLTPLTALHSQDLFIERLPDHINSVYDEITPVVTRDGGTLFFTRVGYPIFNTTLIIDSINIIETYPDMYAERLSWVYGQLGGREHAVHPERSKFNQDIWISKVEKDTFSLPEHPEFPLNNALTNSMVSLTPDPNAYYILNRFERNGDMARGFSVIRSLGNGSWSFPEPIEIDEYYTILSDVNLTMSFDGQLLILSCTRHDSRDMDLYVCFRTGNNTWSAPKNLGPQINSFSRETTPFLSEDNLTLFFSSNRPGGYGGNDIYKSSRLDDSWLNWSSPECLPSPINAQADDGQPFFNMSTGYIYFASKRHGSSDLYRAKLQVPKPTEITFKGRIINNKTGRLIPNAVLEYTSKWTPTNELPCTDGTFEFTIPKGIPFSVRPQMPGFTGSGDTLFLPRDYVYFLDQYVDFYMDPLEQGSRIALKPIYFQRSKAIIMEESYSELNRLGTAMDLNPDMSIRIEGHTDNVGRLEDLIELSEDRANAVKTYLVKQSGISPQRIYTVGYGPQHPISDNMSDENRSLNRRVEVIVTH